MLNDCHNIFDLRDLARRRLPAPIFNMMDGGTESELTLRRNTEAFDDVKLIPKCLVNVETLNTKTRILGQEIEWPVICSPTGGTRAFHNEGELAVARAAAKAGTLYGLSTFSTHSIEKVAAASNGPKMFQLYISKDRDLTRSFVERAKKSGYGALCVTVDTSAIGKWERDLRSGIRSGRLWPLSTIFGFAQHPLWVLRRLGRGEILSANFLDAEGKLPKSGGGAEHIDPSIEWKDIRQVADWWDGPLAIKGIMSADDARRAEDFGASAVIVSNHGGRTLDGSLASFEALPDVVRAVGDRLEVILESGVRRGVHVLKALALGAKACSIGRPYLYGLSAGGEAGVTKALTILRTELEIAMKLAGCPDLASIDESLIKKSA